MRQHRRGHPQHHGHAPREEIGDRRWAPLIGHMHELDLRAHGEQLGGEMRHGADPDRRVGELARLRFRQGDQLLHARHTERGINGEDERQERERRDRREILGEVEAEIGIDRRVRQVRGRTDVQGIAVRRRARDELRGDAAAGAGAALDHQLLAERLAHVGADQAGGDVGGRARREADDQPQRLRWKSPARAPGAAATAVSAMTSVRISAHTARRCIARPPLALFLRRVARCGDFGGIILCRAAARGDVAYWHSAARCGGTKALQLKRRRQAARSQGPARTVRHTRAHHAMLVLILRSAQRKGCGRLQYGCARLEG